MLKCLFSLPASLIGSTVRVLKIDNHRVKSLDDLPDERPGSLWVATWSYQLAMSGFKRRIFWIILIHICYTWYSYGLVGMLVNFDELWSLLIAFQKSFGEVPSTSPPGGMPWVVSVPALGGATSFRMWSLGSDGPFGRPPAGKERLYTLSDWYKMV